MYCCSGYVVMCLQSVLLCDLMLTHVLHYRGRGGERPGVPTGMLATVCEWALDVGFQTVCEQEFNCFCSSFIKQLETSEHNCHTKKVCKTS
jgi:hypothetical protein